MPLFAKRLLAGLLISLVGGLLAATLLPVLGLTGLTPTTLLVTGIVIGAFLGTGLTPSATSNRQITAGQKTIPGNTQTIFVGNLSFRAHSEQLKELFAPYGKIHAARIVTDRHTRKPRGFGFVEMDGAAADVAIQALNGSEFSGRELNLSIAKQRDPR